MKSRRKIIDNNPAGNANASRWNGRPVAASFTENIPFVMAVIVRTQGIRLPLLKETLTSISRQTEPSFAVVVVHATLEMLESVVSVCRETPSLSWVVIHAVETEKKRGYPLNVGLQYLLAFHQGVEAVAFLDDDDIQYTDFSARMIEGLRKSGADVICAASNRRIPDGPAEPGYRPECFLKLFVSNFVPINTYIIRMATYANKTVFFDESLDVVEDWKFLLQLLEQGYRFEAVQEVLSEFRIISDGNKQDKDNPEKWEKAHNDIYSFIQTHSFLMNGQMLQKMAMDQNTRPSEKQNNDTASNNALKMPGFAAIETSILSGPSAGGRAPAPCNQSPLQNKIVSSDNKIRRKAETTAVRKRMSNQNSLISIVIPAYNHEQYVAEAIESVLCQTYENFEIIAIDDGSMDNTYDEMKRMEDPRIRVFRQTNIGAAQTINRGIDLSKGQYIAILNSDDTYHPDRLACFMEYMEEHPGTMILSSLVQPITQSGDPLMPGSGNAFHEYWLEWYEAAITHLRHDGDVFYSLLQSNFVVTTSNIFMDARIFQTEKKFPLLSYCHDYAFLLRVVQTHPFGIVHQKLMQYRLHDTNTIRDDHFLKRLEIQYAVFHELNLDDILIGSSSLPRKTSNMVFRGLEKNPDINQVILLAKKDEQILKHMNHLDLLTKEKQRYAEEYRLLSDKLNSYAEENKAQSEHLHRYAEENKVQSEHLHRYALELAQKDAHLAEVGRQLADLSNEVGVLHQKCESCEKDLVVKAEIEADLMTQIRHQDIHLQEMDRKIDFLEKVIGEKERIIAERERVVSEKDRFLEEIFASKGWRWLTRYRDFKLSLIGKPAAPPERLDSPGPPDPVDEKTYHATLFYPPEPNRPKVIHAIANFNTGGSSRLVVDLFEHLGHKYDQEVMTFFIPMPLAYSGMPVHDFSGDVTESQIETFLQEKNAQILHVHYWGEGDAAWYRKVFHAAENWAGILIENINTPVVPFVSDRVDHYVYVSEYAKNFAACEAEKSSVIHPGSNLTMFDRKEAPIPDNVIGMVYRLAPDKLREDAMTVFVRVVKKRPRTRVLIVGGGEYLDAYQRHVAHEEGVTANFQFTGYVPYETLPDYYQQMSIFVAPVWKESFGQVSPFAMSMKIPVVGYRIGALPEILGSDDLLATNPEDLSDIIVTLLDDRKKRIEIGYNNHLRVHERFSVGTMVAAYEKLYERLIHEHRIGGGAA